MAQVLLVEDEDLTRLALETRLHVAGHQVFAAASVDEAWDLLAGTLVPDVVVTDMFMPGGSGLFLVAGLRVDPDRADVPVVFLSARALPGDVAAGAALGAEFLSKPVKLPELAAVIDRMLEASAAARGVAEAERCSALELEAERALYQRLYSGFLLQAPQLLDDLALAVSEGDVGLVEERAHRLRGLALTLGADSLARECAHLEDSARAGTLPLPGSVVRVERELELTSGVFRELTAELAAEPAAPAA